MTKNNFNLFDIFFLKHAEKNYQSFKATVFHLTTERTFPNGSVVENIPKGENTMEDA